MINKKNIRQVYLRKDHCQPKKSLFSLRNYGIMKRKFISSWFKNHYIWLEYNISKETVFFLIILLSFKIDHKNHAF